MALLTEAIVYCPCESVYGCPRCEALTDLLFNLDTEDSEDEAA